MTTFDSPVARRLPRALAAALCALAAATQAAPTLYLNQAGFLAAVGAPVTDGFDDLPQSLVATPLVRSVGPYSYQANASYNTGPDDAFFNAGSGADTWLTANGDTDVITFSGFSAGVRAIGGLFFGTDIAGLFQAGEDVLLTATDDAGSTSTTLSAATLSSFAGFVTTGALQSLTVSLSSHAGQGFPTVNDIVLAGAVPEPGALLLALTGLGLAGAAARRRRG